MSVYSAKTGLSSILKAYSPMERNKAKTSIINKVRFEVPQRKGLSEVVSAALEHQNYNPLNEFVELLKSEIELTDDDFLRIMNDARKMLYTFDTKFSYLVECILALSWTKRSAAAKQAYSEFCVDLMVGHSRFITFAIEKCISQWIPTDTDAARWNNGTPTSDLHSELEAIHKLLERILTAIPMAYDAMLENIERMFPYFKRAPHIIAGYMHNVLWLTAYKPIFTSFAIELIVQKMIILDVNAPRDEIEEMCSDDEENDEADMDDADEQIFEMEDCSRVDDMLPMKHPIAHTLDICMEKLYAFLYTKSAGTLNLNDEQKQQQQKKSDDFFKILLTTFNSAILPSHNTHHVQFLVFYYCSFKSSYAETFLSSLWSKIKNPNVAPVIRQAAVGYIASFLARSKFISLSLLRYYLKELCDWAHQYIERCDQYRSNGSLKANLVFFTTCQAIFYVIAFRSRDLTADKKDLLFLQTLQLSALVTCNFNPLRVCLPPVATAFAGVTRAYQLAYCHTILERNARRKLATVYANETATPEETLDTFFPFDPYMLKMSGTRIESHYLQYQASDAEEQVSATATVSQINSAERRRKRGDSEMADDVDDFLFSDKRQKFLDLAKSQEREAQFTYGLSPGFHN